MGIRVMCPEVIKMPVLGSEMQVYEGGTGILNRCGWLASCIMEGYFMGRRGGENESFGLGNWHFDRAGVACERYLP